MISTLLFLSWVRWGEAIRLPLPHELGNWYHGELISLTRVMWGLAIPLPRGLGKLASCVTLITDEVGLSH